MSKYVQNIPDWSYLTNYNGDVFQTFSSELSENELYPATFEYCFDLKKKIDVPLKSNNRDYYRLGIGFNINQLHSMGFSDYIAFFQNVQRELSCVKRDDITKVVTPEQGLKNIINSITPTDEAVKQDLIYILELLKKSIDLKIVESLGIEGSLCIGVSNKKSDIDLLIDGSSNYLYLSDCWKNIIKKNKRLLELHDSKLLCDEMYNHRKNYIPFTKKEILFHEDRKMFAYLQNNDQCRKINIVGKLNNDEPLYKERNRIFFDKYKFYPVGICYGSGVIEDDRFGYYIPSIYETKITDLKISNCVIDNPNVSYIIDYIGSYYMQMRVGENFECCGMLEQMYYQNNPINEYRISLNPWDGHVQNKMYLKKINN